MIYDYKEYVKLIKEGLISTHNIEKYSGSLDIQLNSVGVMTKIESINEIDKINERKN